MNIPLQTQVIEEAIAAFNRIGGGKLKLARVIPNYAQVADFHVELETGAGKLDYFVEVKTGIQKNTRMQFLLMKDRFPRFLAVTRYVNPVIAEQMKQDEIEFIDTAGNAFIKNPNIFIYIKGNKPLTLLKKDLPTRAFRQAGVKLLFALFREPELLERTYREISETANVALGTVAGVMGDLRKLGNLAKNEFGFRFVNQEELLNKWATAYAEHLRPRLRIGTYFADPGWWEGAIVDTEKEQWGGEVAAAKLIHTLRPEIATIYTSRENLNDFLLKNRLKKDPDGNTEILERFWLQTPRKQPQDTVPTILVYADLLATGDPRNIEAARTLFEREIHRLNRKN
jgi:hypothetical protein